MRPAVLLVALCLAACQADRRCRRALEEKFGLGQASAEQICQSSCEDNRRFGIDERTCRWLKAGAVGAPPSPAPQ